MSDDVHVTSVYGKVYRYGQPTTIASDPVSVRIRVDDGERVVRMSVNGIEFVMTPDEARLVAASLQGHADAASEPEVHRG